MNWIVPEWTAPGGVRALSTTRTGGHSTGPWRSLNLGLNCGDDPAAVLKNRETLRAHLPAEPQWLRQQHGAAVFIRPPAGENRRPEPNAPAPGTPGAEPITDAQVARQPGQICALLTADCLPVLFCDRSGSVVAAAHAGWRGLAAGILENTAQAMARPPGQLLAWLGPAIGAGAYEVGDEVRAVFMDRDQASKDCFRKQGERWLFDLYAMARYRLARVGVTDVSGGTHCTHREPERFFSYRRDGVTGRMASLIWMHE